MRKRHILIMGNFIPRAGGPGAVAHALADKLSLEGFKTSEISYKKNKILRFIDICFTMFRNAGIYDTVIIYAYSGLAFIAAEAAARISMHLKKPYILYLHGGNLPKFSDKRSERIRNIFSKAANILAPSDYLSNVFKEKGYSVSVIPNFIEPKNFNYRKRSNPKPRLFWLRAFHRIYNPQMAIMVLAYLRKEINEATLVMAGSDKGELRPTKALAKNTGVDNSAYFMDFLNKAEINKIGGEQDIFINTARIDNMPLTILEAIAMGLPIVSTNVGGIPYLLEDRKDALLVSDNDHAAMANAIKELLQNPALAEQLATNARKKAEQFTWERIRPLWLEAFHKID